MDVSTESLLKFADGHLHRPETYLTKQSTSGTCCVRRSSVPLED